MSRHAARARSGKDRTSLYQEVTDKIITATILDSESTTYSSDQAILFTACDALEHDALQKAISPTRQIDHWLASDFEGTIVFDEGDEHAACENSECRAHDNLNAIPLAVSAGDKAAA